MNMRCLIYLYLALGVEQIHGHPLSHGSKALAKRTVDLDAFRLKVASDYVDSTAVVIEPPSFAPTSPEETATELVKKTVPGATFRLVQSYTSNNRITHFYFKQTANDLDIDNADFNVNIGVDGAVFSFGNSFYAGDIPPAADLEKRDELDPAEALKGAVEVLQLPVQAQQATSEPKEGNEVFALKNTNGAVKEPEAKLVYFVTPAGSLALTWRVETDIYTNWLLSYVDVKNPDQVHGVVDYTSEATYEVYPWGIMDPTEGERISITDPWNEEASEFGWHSTGTEEYDTTRGNNAIAHENHDGGLDFLNNSRPVDPEREFVYTYSLSEPDYKTYIDASVTQLFYTANKYHDLLYTLGFNEAAGNFEVNNNGAGGLGNDFVILNAQDGSGKNNALFSTPPDGNTPRMMMFIWNRTDPVRDCSFDAGVVIHEYTHGLSNRLTGGPLNTRCLNTLESGGMGEGWSDFFALAIRLKPDDTRATNYGLGTWVTGNETGIRVYKYSTDMTVNPHTYDDVNNLVRVHPIGTVWATMLYEVLWNLIDKHGKNQNQFPEFDSNGVPTDGRFLAMKIVLDAMALQPCNPNFVSSRDAILDADKALTGGQNSCEIWKGFAKRGLGTGAIFSETARTESFELPQGC